MERKSKENNENEENVKKAKNKEGSHIRGGLSFFISISQPMGVELWCKNMQMIILLPQLKILLTKKLKFTKIHVARTSFYLFNERRKVRTAIKN